MKIKEITESYDWEREEGYDFENPLQIIDSPDVWDEVEELEGDIVEAWEEETGKSYRELYGKRSGGYKEFWSQQGVVENVSLNKIVCTEKWLKKDQLDAIMSGSAKSSSALPLIHNINGTYVATDGNHRIVAAHLSGAKSIKCRVLHAPNTLNESANTIYYHGTNREFGKFEIGSEKANRATNITGVYFTPHQWEAEDYGKRVIQARLHYKKLFNVQKWNDINGAMKRKALELLTRYTTYKEQWLQTAIIPDLVEKGYFAGGLRDVSGDIKREILLAGGYDAIKDGDHIAMLTTDGIEVVSEGKEQVNEITMDHRTSKGEFDRSDLDEFIDRAYPVGNVKGYKIFLFDEDEPEEMHYLVGDPNSEGFLGYVSLIFGDRDKFYRTNVFFDPEIQGKGLAVPLYAFAIKHSGQTVVSDLTQTKGSKLLWQKLAKTPGINVYGWDIRTKKFFHYDPDIETDEEIWSDNKNLSDQHAELIRKIRELDYEFGQHEMSEEEYEEARARLIQMTKDIQDQGPTGHRHDVRLVATTK